MNAITLKRNNLFPSIFDDLFKDEWSDASVKRIKNSFPAVNIKNSEKHFELDVAIPGLKKDDIKIDLDGDILTISSENKEEIDYNEDGYTRKEFYFNSFKRSFSIPEIVEIDKIDASYIDGILKITLPKQEETVLKSKTIKIK